jgi:shikimate dehydrogenase
MSEPLTFAVIGSPVAHSRSPAMHAAAYRELGMPHRYEKIETSEEELPERVAALRAGTFAGLNVTVPHKTKVLAFVDEIDPSARATGAANTLVRIGESRVRAFNTDAPALADELAELAGDRAAFEGKRALVLGTGGAARAAIFALGELGVRAVTVRGRTPRADLADVLAAAAPSATLAFEPLAAASAEAPDLVAIVQATSAGMHGGPSPSGDAIVGAVAWDTLSASCVAYDVVYAPPDTAFLGAAAARGLRHAGGLGMLVRQGALAFERWLGVAPSLAAMRSAIAPA